MNDPNILISGLSRKFSQDGVDFRIEIYRLEHDPNWTLEVVDEDGTSTVWDDLFQTDQEALDEALKTIQEEGPSAFRDAGNVISFPRP